MKRIIIASALVVIAVVGLWLSLGDSTATWDGVDVTVVGKFAEQAGRPATSPLINTDQGDLLLFVFLVAGVVGGFALGYCYRGLFVEGAEPEQSEAQR